MKRGGNMRVWGLGGWIGDGKREGEGGKEIGGER